MSAKNNDFNWKDSVSLKDYFDGKFQDLEDKMNLQFKLNQTALDKSETSTNLRLENMNEFRESLNDQTKTYLTRNEYELKHENLEQKLSAIQKIVWMGLGALAVLELLLEYIFKGLK